MKFWTDLYLVIRKISIITVENFNLGMAVIRGAITITRMTVIIDRMEEWLIKVTINFKSFEPGLISYSLVKFGLIKAVFSLREGIITEGVV